MTELDPAYLVLGNDRAKMSRSLARMRKHFDAEAIESYAAANVEAAEVIDGAMMMGLLAARKLIIVTGVDSWKADDVSAIVDYLADPSPDTVLLMTADKLASNSRLLKAMRKHTVVDCVGADGREGVVVWAQKRFKELGIDVNRRDVGVLVDMCGHDSLDRIDTDIQRIVIYAGGEPVTGDMIRTQATTHTEEKVFALTDVWAKRDRPALLQMSQQLLDQRESPVFLAMMLSKHLRGVQVARRALETSSPTQVTRQLVSDGLAKGDWAAKKYVEQAQRISLPQAEAALARAVQLEAEMKGESYLTKSVDVETRGDAIVFQRGLAELV